MMTRHSLPYPTTCRTLALMMIAGLLAGPGFPSHALAQVTAPEEIRPGPAAGTPRPPEHAAPVTARTGATVEAGGPAVESLPPLLRQVRLGVADTGSPLPEDLTAPAGRSRWDLSGLALRARYLATTKEDAAGRVLVGRDGASLVGAGAASLADFGSARWIITDPAGGDAARRWLFPDRHPELLQPGSRASLELEELGQGTTGSGSEPLAERLFITVETVGIGWVHLPSGPREAALQHARILRGPASGRHLEPAAELYRWVDPRAGVVAQITWRATGALHEVEPEGEVHETNPDGRASLEGTFAPHIMAGSSLSGQPEVLILEASLTGAADLKIYVDQIDRPPFAQVTYGYDKGPGTAISSLVPEAPATMGDLVALDHWDFSGNTASVVIASHATDQITAAETCNFEECGYTLPGLDLSREDFLNLLDPNDVRFTHTVTETEERPEAVPPDTTIWLRAGTVNEGREPSGLLATDGESRLCFVSDASDTRSPVPLFRFANQDARGYFMQAGDAGWTSGPFNCEPNISARVCGVLPTGRPDPIFIAGDPFSQCSGRTGSQFTDVVKAGVLTTPSGHTFNALLLRSVADFCAYSSDTCSGFLAKLDDIRTVNYLWMVPELGTTVRLQSPQVSDSDANCDSSSDPNLCFTTLETSGLSHFLRRPPTSSHRLTQHAQGPRSKW